MWVGEKNQICADFVKIIDEVSRTQYNLDSTGASAPALAAVM